MRHEILKLRRKRLKVESAPTIESLRLQAQDIKVMCSNFVAAMQAKIEPHASTTAFQLEKQIKETSEQLAHCRSQLVVKVAFIACIW